MADKVIQLMSENGEDRLFPKVFVDAIYPVGSIYMSVNSTSPATLFGGTWEQITGRFLLGTGYPGENSDNWFGTIKYTQYWNAPVGSTGGEDFHTLTTSEMPSHNHNFNSITVNGDTFGVYGGGGQGGWGLGIAGVNNNYGRFGIQNNGSGEKHNNMPPYFAVYMWKRTA